MLGFIHSLYRKHFFCRRWSSIHEKSSMSFFFTLFRLSIGHRNSWYQKAPAWHSWRLTILTVGQQKNLISSFQLATGWSIMTAKEYELITRARKRYIRWERCHFVTLFGTFWYLVSKKSHNHSVIIHLWRLWRSKTVEICKIHRKLMIFKSHYCFANISGMKA